MENEGGAFDEVLREAQELGYAEADPTLDVGGYDAAHKIAILAAQCFEQKIDYSKISVEGITKIQDIDVMFAGHNGYRVKLLCIAKHLGDVIDLYRFSTVQPRAVLRADDIEKRVQLSRGNAAVSVLDDGIHGRVYAVDVFPADRRNENDR